MLIKKQLLVGRQRRVEVGERHTLRIVAYNHTHHRSRVAIYLVILWRVHNTCTIQLAQALCYDVDILARQAWYSVMEVGSKLVYLLLLY